MRTTLTNPFFANRAQVVDLARRRYFDLLLHADAYAAPRAAAIVAAVIPLHAHYDHAMDAPEVARRTGALLLGSESSANVARGWGLPERQIQVAKLGQASGEAWDATRTGFSDAGKALAAAYDKAAAAIKK